MSFAPPLFDHHPCTCYRCERRIREHGSQSRRTRPLCPLRFSAPHYHFSRPSIIVVPLSRSSATLSTLRGQH